VLIGYARVSTKDQNLDRQLDCLSSAGAERIFQEKITGTKKERPELDKLFEILRNGDILVVSELTRLSRSIKDLISISEKLQEIGVNLKSLKENIDTTTAAGKAMFNMLAVFSQFERDLILERTKAGLESARARGRKGGRPKRNSKDIDKAMKLYHSKEYTLKEIREMTGVPATTLYDYIKGKKQQELKKEIKDYLILKDGE
jgi:DNA invertase Pin-like site-specific DNA recombinase